MNDARQLRGGIPDEDYLGSLTKRCRNCDALHLGDEEPMLNGV